MAWLKKHRRRLLLLLIAVLLLLPLMALAALYWAVDLLTVENSPAKADVIVVLGGEPRHRMAHARVLYEQGLAPRILVSGEGDADYTRWWLTNNGVPASAISLEAKSENTWENAAFSVTKLRESNSKRVILVTSWFHSRRALKTFQKAAPDFTFISLPTVEDRPKRAWPNKAERGYASREYLKLMGYWVRYGVFPLLFLNPKH